MKPVKIAQVGLAHGHAYPIVKTLKRQSQFFDLAAGALMPGEDLAFPWPELPVYTVDELLDMPDLEAVAVECDVPESTEVARRFIAKGIPVHLDKPASPDHEAFVQLFREAEEAGVPLHMGYMYRYNPAVRRALESVRRGELGEILSVEAQMSIVLPEETRKWLACFPGGMMYYLGCHLADLVLLFQGQPLEIIPMNTKTEAGLEAPDYAFAAFRYPHGVSFIKSNAREINGFDRRQLVISGTKGTVEIRPWEAKLDITNDLMTTVSKVSVEDSPIPNCFDRGLVSETPVFDRYEDMMEDFAQVVRGRAPLFTAEHEIALHKLLLDCCR